MYIYIYIIIYMLYINKIRGYKKKQKKTYNIIMYIYNNILVEVHWVFHYKHTNK